MEWFAHYKILPFIYLKGPYVGLHIKLGQAVQGIGFLGCIALETMDL